MSRVVNLRGTVPTDPAALQSFVLRQAPADFYRRFLALTQESYAGAWAEARRRFIDTVAHDFAPQLRYALIEQGLTTLAVNFGGMTVRRVPNRTRTSFHTEVCCGRAVFTVCGTTTPYDRLDDAVFRQSLAESPQMAMPLFDDQAAASPRTDEFVWAALVHCPAETDPAAMGAVHIVVKDRDCSTTLARVDLIKRYVVTRRPAAGESAEPRIRLRPGVRRPPAASEQGDKDA